MKYSGVKTNENLRFLKCPVCGNDEFSYEAGFCRVCGSAVYNYCQDHYDENGYRINSGCGRPNPGNARYCEYCGNPTLLFDYLSSWEDEKEHFEKYATDETDSALNEASAQSKNDADSPSIFEEVAASEDDLTNTFDEFSDDDEE